MVSNIASKAPRVVAKLRAVEGDVGAVSGVEHLAEEGDSVARGMSSAACPHRLKLT